MNAVGANATNQRIELSDSLTQEAFDKECSKYNLSKTRILWDGLPVYMNGTILATVKQNYSETRGVRYTIITYNKSCFKTPEEKYVFQRAMEEKI